MVCPVTAMLTVLRTFVYCGTNAHVFMCYTMTLSLWFPCSLFDKTEQAAQHLFASPRIMGRAVLNRTTGYTNQPGLIYFVIFLGLQW